MRSILKAAVFVALFLLLAPAASTAAEISADELAGQFNGATDVQKSELENNFRYKIVSVSGIVENAEQWNTFYEPNDTSAVYWRVTTARKPLAGGAYYNVMIFYKDEAQIKDLNKGQPISMEGPLLKIIDDAMMYSVCIFAGEPSESDKAMLLD